MITLLDPLPAANCQPPTASSKRAKRWHKDYDWCRHCGGTDRPHRGYGLCSRCHQPYAPKSAQPLPEAEPDVQSGFAVPAILRECFEA